MRLSNHFSLIHLTFILSVAIVSYPMYYTHAAPRLPIVKSAKEKGVSSCRSANSINPGDDMYVKGRRFLGNTSVDIYVVAQNGRCLWKIGDTIGADVSNDGKNTVTTTGKGKIPCTLIWTAATFGNYDIIVDTDQNGVLDEGDAVDSTVVGDGISVERQASITPFDSGNCNSSQHGFLTSEDVYVKGRKFPRNTTVKIYVKTNQPWSFGDPIGADDGDGVDIVTTNSKGRLPCTEIWTATLTAGVYDIIVDINQNGSYDPEDPITAFIVGGGGSSAPRQEAVQPIVNPAGVRPDDGVPCGRSQFFFTFIDPESLLPVDIYAEGRKLSPNLTVDIYVKKNDYIKDIPTDRKGWMPGDTIGADDGDGVVETATTTLEGDLPCTKIWDNTVSVLVGGEYDIVVDVNRNTVYDAGDAINRRCFEEPIEPVEQETGAGFVIETTTTTSTTSTTTSTTTTSSTTTSTVL